MKKAKSQRINREIQKKINENGGSMSKKERKRLKKQKKKSQS